MSSIFEMAYDLIEHKPFWEMVNLKVPSKLKPIGEGSKGIVYNVGDSSKVIKITEDSSEADASSIVAKKGKVEGVNRIYGVYKWKRYPMYYIIVQDEVDVSISRAYKIIDNITDAYIDLYPERPDEEAIESEYYTNSVVKEMIDYLRKKNSISIVKGLGNLRKLGIMYRDLHAGNIGFDKSNKAVIIDLGYSKSPGGDVKVFEKYSYE